MDQQEYAGFWIRAIAAVIDSVFLLMIILPLLTILYGEEYWLDRSTVHGVGQFVISYILPAAAVIVFWIYRSATPGKMFTGISIVDAKTGARPSTRQCIVRYLGYYVSLIPFLLGMVWIGIDKRKQGWHDKLAGTVVIKDSRHG